MKLMSEQKSNRFTMSTNKFRAKLLCCMLAGVVCAQAPNPLTVPAKQRKEDATIAREVVRWMPRAHITRHPINDEISERIQKQVFRFFDPTKRIFLQSDVDELQVYKTEHDDLIKAGDLSFIFKLRERFLQRLSERIKWAKEILATELIDVNKPDTISVDPDATNYCANEEEAKQRWRVQVKYDLCQRMLDNETPDKAKEKLSKRYDAVLRNWMSFDARKLPKSISIHWPTASIHTVLTWHPKRSKTLTSRSTPSSKALVPFCHKVTMAKP